jgi:hypothetical protein
MTEEVWEPTRKAVHVDAEGDEYVPEFTGAPPGTTMPRHADDDERAGYEAQLFVFLVDRGFESEGSADYTAPEERACLRSELRGADRGSAAAACANQAAAGESSQLTAATPAAGGSPTACVASSAAASSFWSKKVRNSS